MKKLIATITALILCISLTACGSKNNAEADNISTTEATTKPATVSPELAKPLVGGKWVKQNPTEIVIFNEDGTASLNDYACEWWYDNCVERYFISVRGMVFNIVIQTEGDKRFFHINGGNYYYTETEAQ